MIYAILGALLVGASLGLFGSGGSILTVPILVYLLHHEDKAAIAESLAIVGAIAFIGAIPYARDRLVAWRIAILFGVPGMAGTYAGAWLAAYVAGWVQLIVFALVMLLAAWFMWRRSRPKAADSTPDESDPADAASARPTQPSFLRIGTEGAAVGVLTGFVGVGGGFLIVPALVLLARLPMHQAVGTSLVIIALKSVTGFAKYLDVLQGDGSSVNWQTIALFIAGGAIGTMVGKRIGRAFDQRALQQGFAVFLVVMAGFILLQETLLRETPQPSEQVSISQEETPDP